MPATQHEPQRVSIFGLMEHGHSVYILLAGFLTVCGTALFLHPELVATRPYSSFALETAHMQAIVQFYVLLLTAGATAWCLQPTLTQFVNALRNGCSAIVLRSIELCALGLACVGLCVFIVHFGRWQYGGWDDNILVDVAWRQISGQRPYIDFLTPTPPLFNYTVALAFRVFGVTWNANLYLASVFSVVTFLWSYALFRVLGMHRTGSLGTSLLVQIAAMLTCCFWWYNNTTLILAALFYLSTFVLLRTPEHRLGQASFVLLLAVLPLSKPNIAGVTIAGCIALLLIASRRRSQVLWLAALGVLLSLGVFLAMHIDIGAMLATYRGISRERGGFSTFGFRELRRGERYITVLWFAALCIPFLWLRAVLYQDVATRTWRRVAFWLMFPLAAVITAYGIMGNGEFRDVECPPLLCSISLLVFLYRPSNARLQRVTFTLMVAMAFSDLYLGAARLRVYTMGQEKFFSWTENERPVPGRFFKDMRASADLVAITEQLSDVVGSSPRPVFFGPRIDFGYAALGLQAPLHWTSFYQPGTAFARSQVPELLRAWNSDRFQTLVFLKGDHSFYPSALLNSMDKNFQRDDHLANVTIYRRRPGS